MVQPYTPYAPMPDINPLERAQGVQNILIQRQEQEARRRALQGGALAGEAIRKGIVPGGIGLDPSKMTPDIQGAPPELIPDAYKAATDAVTSGATAAKGVAANAQDDLAYMGNSLGVLLSSHPDGIPTADAVAVVGSLNSLKVIQPLTAAAMNLELAKLPNDKARSKYIAEKLIAAQKGAVWTTTVEVTNPDGTKGLKLLADVIAEATGVTPPRPDGEEEPLPGEAPATDKPTSGLKTAVTAPSSAQAAAAGQAGQFYSKKAQADLAAANASVDASANLMTLLEEAQRFRGGPLSGPLYELLAATNQLTGAEIAAHSVAAEEVFNKTAMAFAAQQAAQLGGAEGATDAGRSQSMIANPNSHISDLGRGIVIKKLLGNQAAIKTVGLLVGPIQGDYLALKKFYGDWAEHGDPRVFQYAMMGSKAERDAMLGAEYVKDPVSGKRHWVGLPDETGKRAKLGEGDRIKLNAFASDLKYADEAGWLKLAVDRFKAQE